jgi:hypothetical protein
MARETPSVRSALWLPLFGELSDPRVVMGSLPRRRRRAGTSERSTLRITPLPSGASRRCPCVRASQGTIGRWSYRFTRLGNCVMPATKSASTSSGGTGRAK